MALKTPGDRSIPKPGELVLSKYRVERIIGEGGMGVVLAIRHIELGELFAMKLLRPSSAEKPGAAARFTREARAAARLRSDHVARVYDVGTLESGAPYMLMEHLEGSDLASILAVHGALSYADVLDYVGQALDAIGEAHSLGLIHRDLKPGNLFLSVKPSGATSLKVLDFGISKEISRDSEPSMTQSGDLVGSPYYMSPEQMRGARDIDTRADIWALGVIMFELLTDTVPFPGKTSTQVCSAVLEGPIPSIRSLVPDVPDEVAAVVSKCLRRDRDKRFERAEDLASALIRVPRSFDGSRSNRTRKLVAAAAGSQAVGDAVAQSTISGRPRSGSSAPAPGAGESKPSISTGSLRKASLASISLTKSAVARTTSPGLGAALEESNATPFDRRAETPQRGVPAKAPPGAVPDEDASDGEAATAGEASPPSSSSRSGDHEPDSLPRASLPGVSELSTDEVAADVRPKPKSRAFLLVAGAVAIAATLLVYVLLAPPKGSEVGKSAVGSPTTEARPAVASNAAETAVLPTAMPTSMQSATTSAIATTSATAAISATVATSATPMASVTAAQPGVMSSAPSATGAVGPAHVGAAAPQPSAPPKPAGSARNPEAIYEGIY